MNRTSVAWIVMVVACVLPAAPASASSLVWAQDDGNLYLGDPASPAAPFQVTLDGSPGAPYELPSQADDGTIVAVRRSGGPPDRIVRMQQNGTVLGSFLPTQLSGGIIRARVSPDGAQIAFQTYHSGNSSCTPGSTGTTFCNPGTFVVSSSGADIDALALWVAPDWVSSTRLAVPFSSGLRIGTWTPGGPAPTDWLDITSMNLQRGIGDIAVSPDGTKLATQLSSFQGSGAVPDALRLWATDGDPAAGGPPTAPPIPVCDLLEPAGGQFRSPSWSPDGTMLAWEETDGDAATDAGNEGIWIGTIPALTLADPCTPITAAFAVADGHHPSFGPAEVNPGPRGTPPAGGTNPATGTGATPATGTATNTTTGPTAGDTAAPGVRGLALTPKSARRGVVRTLKLTLSEAAVATTTIQRVTRGRRAGSRCVASTPGNRKAKTCSRAVDVKRTTKTASLPAGVASIRVATTAAGLRLARGSYRVSVTAKDRAGNVSAPVSVTFTIR